MCNVTEYMRKWALVYIADGNVDSGRQLVIY